MGLLRSEHHRSSQRWTGMCRIPDYEDSGRGDGDRSSLSRSCPFLGSEELDATSRGSEREERTDRQEGPVGYDLSHMGH